MSSALDIFKSAGAIPLPDNQQWMHRFQIKSASSSRLYTVAQNKQSRSWACSCMGWIRFRHCKHLTKLDPQLKQIRG